jgi:hypothetical protein
MAGSAVQDRVGPGGTVAGVEGNSRLTATTGALLTLLLLVEGVTLLDVRGYITLHTAIGLVLIGPLALKCASTMYRFTSYYFGRRAYVVKGPPHPLLRVIGPLVVVSSVAVVGTGVALLAVRGRSDVWLALHKGSFVVWFVVTALHFLGHLRDATVDTAREFRMSRGDPAKRGKAVRVALVAVSLLAGVAVAAAFTPSASQWHLHSHDEQVHDGAAR